MTVAPRREHRIDVSTVARGSSHGFTVLVLGGLASPALGTVAPQVGSLALAATAIAAFVLAGLRGGRAGLPAMQGALAALGSYVLVLPLVLFHPAGRDPLQIALTAACALMIGWTTALVAARTRDRSAESR